MARLVWNAALLLIVVFTASFLLIDVLLFASIAEKGVTHIADNGAIATLLVRSLYAFRDVSAAAVANSTTNFARATTRVADYADRITAIVNSQYKNPPSSAQSVWFASTLNVRMPTSNATWEPLELSYFEAVSLTAQRMKGGPSVFNFLNSTGASTLSFAEATKYPFFNGDVAEIRDALFVSSNLLRSILPNVFVSGKLTEGDVQFFGKIATLCFIANCIICCLIVFLIVALYHKTLRYIPTPPSSQPHSAVVSGFRSAMVTAAIAQQVPHRSQKHMVTMYRHAEGKIALLLKEHDNEQVCFGSSFLMAP